MFKDARKQLFLIFTVTFALVLLPWIAQIAFTPAGHVPTGFVAGGEDYNTYLAKMKWGAAGNWTYPNRYTPEQTEAVPIYGFFLLLGRLADWTGLSLQWVFHLSKAALGGLALCALWVFLRKNTGHPGIAFLLAVGASGGYLNSNAELFVQGHLYLSLLVFPHYLIDALAYVAVFHAYLARDLRPGGRVALAATGGFFISAVHPFLLALVLTVPVIYSVLYNRPAVKRALSLALVAAAASLPLVTLQAMAVMEAAWLNAWREQTSAAGVLLPVFLVFVYGLAGVLGWGRVPFALRKGSNESFWAVWLVMAALLAVFAPLPNRREFAFFLSIPLGALASVPVARFLQWIKGAEAGEWSKKGAALAVLALGVWHAAGVYGSLAAPVSKEYTELPHYLPVEYLDGLAWLDARAKEGDVAMTLPETGNFIPAWSLKVRPYVGHPSETLGYQEKKAKAGAFFGVGGAPDENALTVLENAGVRWVVFDKIVPEKKGDYDFLLGLLGPPLFENNYLSVWEAIQ